MTLEHLCEELEQARRERDTAIEEREAAQARARELEAQLLATRRQLAEVLKLVELQKADLDRLRAEREPTIRPNCPERVPAEQLQQALERVVTSFGPLPAANDPPAPTELSGSGDPTTKGSRKGTTTKGTPKRRHEHGRRRLDLTKLPVEILYLDPEEVRATGGEGFVFLGEEAAERLVYRPGSFVRLHLVRRKWARVAASATTEVDPASGLAAAPTVLVAPLPDSVWPRVMADPSAIARVIVAKYEDVLPLNRQERISAREGFVVPKSTQCGWLEAGYDVTYRVVDAMFDEARQKAFCIATDATGAPLRTLGACVTWHLFVFVADHDHVIFRFTQEHSSAAITALLKGFKGHLLVDAAPIYDVLFKDHGMTEVVCWFHARRYFWRALDSARDLALQPLALMAQLFALDRACQATSMPERTEKRAKGAAPILKLLEAWIEHHRDRVDPRSPLDQAIGYYTRQREALHRFLLDGRLPLDNGVSERELRNVALGRHNWKHFETRTGLRWYSVFRSLIASCALHGLNAQEYLEQLLRLAPHWPRTRMLELAPKYWATTLAGLDAHHRAILVRPWELRGTAVSTSRLDAVA